MSELTLDELMFLYAAGALDDDEREGVEQRLSSRESAARESLERAGATLAEVPLALEPRLPRAEVGAGIVARIRAERDATAPRPQIRKEVGEVSRRRGIVWIAAAAALLLISLVPFGAWRMQQTSEDARIASQRAESAALAKVMAAESTVADLAREKDAIERRAEFLASELEELRERNRGLHEEVRDLRDRLEVVRRTVRAPDIDTKLVEAHRAEIVEAEARLAIAQRALGLVRAPDAAMIELVAANPSDRGAASVFWDRGLRHCYLHARSLAPADPSTPYVLWIEYASGRQVAIAEFAVPPDRPNVEAWADLPVGLGEITRTWITREAASGVASPMGPIVLREQVPDPTREAPSVPRRYRRRS